MKLARLVFDKTYDLIRDRVFEKTQDDPECAHELFVNTLRKLYDLHLDGFVLGTGMQDSGVSLSNAAGFNKHGDIPPAVLKNLGFERGVIGTVTNDYWEGNPRPRMQRFPETESLVNWMYLPGNGSQIVADRLNNYRACDLPLTINVMSTPEKEGDEVLKDLEGTVRTLRDTPNVDRFELNISCPNKKIGSAIDVRKKYLSQTEGMICVVRENMHPHQDLYLKVSPDEEEVSLLLSIGGVDGYTTTNTTTDHDQRFIPHSPGKGGASGAAVYERSLDMQKRFAKSGKSVIACGGISSIERARERLLEGADEIQLYTPIIFKGPRIIRELKEINKK